MKSWGVNRFTVIFTVLTWVVSAASLGGGPAVRSLDSIDASDRISPLLLQEVEFVKARPAYDSEIPLIVQLKPEAYPEDLSSDDPGALPSIRGYATRLRASEITDLLEWAATDYVTVDAVIRSSSFNVANPNLETIGADQIQAASLSYDGPFPVVIPGNTGDGVTIAVFDSGIDSFNSALIGRVVERVDFTSGKL